MIAAIALDDEPLALKIIENFCSRTDVIRLERTFTKPSAASAYLKKFPVDLIFLDIQMPSLSGIDFYKNIQQKTMVVFTTAFSEYAVEGFNLSAVDYLLKPFTYERFEQAVEKVNEYYSFMHKVSSTQKSQIYVRADYKLVKIEVSDILFVEGLDDYLRIHLKGGIQVVTRMTLKTMEQKLPNNDFIRVHRSYIVSFPYIDSVRNKVICLGEKEIPIGRSFEKSFFEKYGV